MTGEGATEGKIRTVAAALSGAVMISFSAIFFALADVDPATGAFFRAAYAVPILFAMWWLRRHGDRRPVRLHWLALLAGVALGTDMVAWHAAIDYIGAGLATLLANTQVIFVTAIAWIGLAERPDRRVLWAIPVILIGVALVSGLGQEGAFGVDPLRGTGLALIAALFYSMFLLAYRRSNQGQGPTTGPLLEASIGAAVAAFVLGSLGSGIDLGLTWPAHGWLVALALTAQVAGWLLIGFALPRLPAAETATIILLQPALTILWGALIFGERPSGLQIIGALVVLAGVGFVAFTRAKTAPAAISASGNH